MDNEELDGVKFSEFPSQTPGNSDEVVGLHAGDNARFRIANIVAAVRNGLANIFVPKTDVGAANGVASLDNTGKVPTSQLPSSTGPEPATATPLMDGTGAVGASTKYAREDHEHPADTNKQAKITASGILKGNGQGGVTAATAGTDYATPAQLDGKANQTQLAYVETGTTASRNYTAGQYIALNGLLYTADTAIASGATFYTSGGNKNLTECVGGGFNATGYLEDITSSVTITPLSSYASDAVIGYSAYKCGKTYQLSFQAKAKGSQSVGMAAFEANVTGLPSFGGYTNIANSYGGRLYVAQYHDLKIRSWVLLASSVATDQVFGTFIFMA